MKNPSSLLLGSLAIAIGVTLGPVQAGEKLLEFVPIGPSTTVSGNPGNQTVQWSGEVISNFNDTNFVLEFPALSLDEGTELKVAGEITFAGDLVVKDSHFRLGLLNSQQRKKDKGWLGYLAASWGFGSQPGAFLVSRKDPNDGIWDSVGSGDASQSDRIALMKNKGQLNSGTPYAFSFSLKKVPSGIAYHIVFSEKETPDYEITVFDGIDPTPNTTTFDRFGIYVRGFSGAVEFTLNQLKIAEISSKP